MNPADLCRCGCVVVQTVVNTDPSSRYPFVAVCEAGHVSGLVDLHSPGVILDGRT